MLAKLWKKVLLAICIIACIFNIMSKLVNRTSLELNLKSVENGESLFSIFKEETEESDTIDGVIQNEETVTNKTTEEVENSVETQTETNETQSAKATDFVIIY